MQTSLFHPLRIDNLDFKNRIILAPPPTLLANPNGSPSDEMIIYYQKLSETSGGAVITECVSISDAGISWKNQLNINQTVSLHGFSRMVEKIRSRGAIPFISLFHGGMNSLNALQSHNRSSSKSYVNDLSTSEIDKIVSDYSESAKAAWRTGFTGIEIQAAEGSIIQQFLSPITNKRKDEYGIADQNGDRLLLDIAAAIRSTTPDLTIICKLSLKDLKPAGRGMGTSIKTASALEKIGIRIFHITEGLVVGDPLKMHPSLHANEPDAPFAEDCHIFKNETGLLTILSGKISRPAIAQDKLRKNVCDFISLGRTINRHKDWIKMASHEIEPWQSKCLRCQICRAATTNCPDRQY